MVHPRIVGGNADWVQSSLPSTHVIIRSPADSLHRPAVGVILSAFLAPAPRPSPRPSAPPTPVSLPSASPPHPPGRQAPPRGGRAPPGLPRGPRAPRRPCSPPLGTGKGGTLERLLDGGLGRPRWTGASMRIAHPGASGWPWTCARRRSSGVYGSDTIPGKAGARVRAGRAASSRVRQPVHSPRRIPPGKTIRPPSTNELT